MRVRSWEAGETKWRRPGATRSWEASDDEAEARWATSSGEAGAQGVRRRDGRGGGVRCEV